MRSSGSRNDFSAARRRVLSDLGVALSALVAGGSGCSFFFPVPHEGEATAEPSQGAVAMGDNFRPGEQWLAEVTVGGIFAGELAVTVGAPCRAPDGRRVFTVRSVGRSAGMVKALADAWSDAKSSIEVVSGLPIRSVADIYDGKAEKHFEIDYQQREYDSLYRKGKDGKERRLSYALPERESAHDIHSVVGMLRNWRPADGTRGYFFAVLGRRLWRSDLRFIGREQLDTPFGDQAAVRIDGLATRLLKNLSPSSSEPKAFRLWFSDDDRRLPLRVWGQTKLAEIQADLVGYGSDDEPMVGTPPLPRAPDAAECPSLGEPTPLAMIHRSPSRGPDR